jgi:radical SAM protein with 4Fe4S-binding SPASM domain
LEELEYRKFLDNLFKEAAKLQIPVSGTFELTARCSLNCRMCYINQPAGDVSQRQRELSAEQWLKIAREAIDEGMHYLLLTGGEPLLRPDFFQIIEPLTRWGIFVSLFTNGTLITKDVAKRLAQSPPFKIEITLYGATEKTYEAVTRIPGSYSLCLKGIENLLEQGLLLVLKSTLTRQNVGELEAMRQLAHSFGVPFLAGWLLTKRRDGKPSEVDDCRLSPREAIMLEATDKASATEWEEAAIRGLPTEDERNFYCLAGKCAFAITPAGEMNVCLDLPLPSAKPLEIGFKSAWEEVKSFVDSAPPLSPACKSCDIRVFCHRCPAWSYLETGTLTEPVPYLCEIARERKRIYGS